MDRVASAGTSSGRGARTAWRTLHAISPASQGTHETEDDSGSESEEDEDLKGEYRGAVLVRSNGQKGLATTNRTNNRLIPFIAVFFIFLPPFFPMLTAG